MGYRELKPEYYIYVLIGKDTIDLTTIKCSIEKI